jgi:hypothetical protein
MKSRRLSMKAKNTSTRNEELIRRLRAFFPAMKNRIYSEYPYSRIVDFNKYNFEDYGIVKKDISYLKADVFMLDWKVVFELMGQQHFYPVRFGGSMADAEAKFARQQRCDFVKRTMISMDDGLLLIEIPFDSELPMSSGTILDMVSKLTIADGNTFRIIKGAIWRIDSNGEPVTLETKFGSK